MLLRSALLLLAIAWSAATLSGQSQDTLDIIRSVREFSPKNVKKLEVRLKKKPQDRKARIQLLSYYSRILARTDAEAAVRGRKPHLLWMVENTPEDDALEYRYIAAVNSRGESLPDPELYEAVRAKWTAYAQSPSASRAVLLNAAAFLGIDDPPAAALLLRRVPADKGRSLTTRVARLCANAILGLRGLNHLTSAATWADPSLTETVFAETCRDQARTSENPRLLAGMASLYYRAAGPAYASEILKTDYTVFGDPLLQRARKLNPKLFALMFVPAETLPTPGKAGPMTVGIAGPVMREKLPHEVPPDYPEAARNRYIQGTVDLQIAVGLTGEVIAVGVIEGPVELQDAAVQAVRQWRYKPSLVNGKPVYAVSRIVVNFTLQ